MRWFAFFSYPLLLLYRFLRLTRRTRSSPIPLRLYWLYRPTALLWLHFFLLDYLLYVLVKLTLNRRQVIVADRFMLDMLVDVAYDTRLNPIKYIIGRFFMLVLYNWIRRGLLSGFVMLVRKEVVFHRRKDVPGKIYVAFRIPVYASLASWLGVPIINGEESVDKNFLSIVRTLGSSRE